jgi:hypothetical protein
MLDTMRDAPGVGLAAPQVGLPLQLAVIEDREELLNSLPAEGLAEKGTRAGVFSRHHQSRNHNHRARKRRFLRKVI